MRLKVGAVFLRCPTLNCGMGLSIMVNPVLLMRHCFRTNIARLPDSPDPESQSCVTADPSQRANNGELLKESAPTAQGCKCQLTSQEFVQGNSDQLRCAKQDPRCQQDHHKPAPNECEQDSRKE